MAKPSKPDWIPRSIAPPEPDRDPIALPRHLHKASGVSTIVRTVEACDAHLADGWALLPPKEDA